MPAHFHRAAATALLACATVAGAQQPPVVRVRREQQFVLARVPVGSELELRVAPGITSVVRFDAQVEHVQVKREGAGQLVWWDVAGQSLLVEPRRELASFGPLPLEVVLVQGSIRIRLVFLLVSHPGEVDTRVDLELRLRSLRTATELEAASPQHEGGSSSRFPVAEMMKKWGLSTAAFQGDAVGAGVRVTGTRDYRVARGRLIVLDVRNPEGARPWFSSEVVRVSPAGVVLEGSGGWAVHMEAPIEPGRHGEVVVVTPEVERDAPVRLEVREKGGRRVIQLEEWR